MKHVVIINRMAKQKNLKELLKEMETTFRARALPYAIHLTKGSAEADAIIASYHDPCRFYICGGDGTLHEVINALQGSSHELVLIPCGTGNDFSRMLKDRKDILAHFHHSLAKEAKAIDVLKVNDHYCINAACFALDSDIAKHVHDENWSLIPRKLAYLTTVLRRVFVYPCNEVELIADGRHVYQGKALFLACNNAKFYGGGFCFTPDAKLDDGKMDVCLIRSFPRWRILYKCPALLGNKPQRLKECSIFQCEHLQVLSKQGMNLDGEPYPDDRIEITVLPKAIRLVNEIK
ncbi:YegS/Rv2252/BmrU family lipid kinase [Massilicoli timonensis]|uniref:diacylglycerol/lipid kinase family protein n=1 Tax=Massilicoli timonensis TaxID=2015901 RepID=UPI0023F429CE|nr:YegS/Rv2252/BmrU family lipid kinase [Massilicoli timonensis]